MQCATQDTQEAAAPCTRKAPQHQALRGRKHQSSRRRDAKKDTSPRPQKLSDSPPGRSVTPSTGPSLSPLQPNRSTAAVVCVRPEGNAATCVVVRVGRRGLGRSAGSQSQPWRALRAATHSSARHLSDPCAEPIRHSRALVRGRRDDVARGRRSAEAKGGSSGGGKMGTGIGRGCVRARRESVAPTVVTLCVILPRRRVGACLSTGIAQREDHGLGVV
jgi:hypothetical protein